MSNFTHMPSLMFLGPFMYLAFQAQLWFMTGALPPGRSTFFPSVIVFHWKVVPVFSFDQKKVNFGARIMATQKATGLHIRISFIISKTTCCIAAFDFWQWQNSQCDGIRSEALDGKRELNCLPFDFELPILLNANF